MTIQPKCLTHSNSSPPKKSSKTSNFKTNTATLNNSRHPETTVSLHFSLRYLMINSRSNSNSLTISSRFRFLLTSRSYKTISQLDPPRFQNVQNLSRYR